MGAVKRPFTQALIVGLAIDLNAGRGFERTRIAYNYDSVYFKREMKRRKKEIDEEIEVMRERKAAPTESEKYGHSLIGAAKELI